MRKGNSYVDLMLREVDRRRREKRGGPTAYRRFCCSNKKRPGFWPERFSQIGKLLPRDVVGAGAVKKRRGNRSKAAVAHQVGIEVVFVTRSKSELDQRAGVGNYFVLPTLVGLELAHGRLGSVVPDACRLAVEVVLADQCFLDLAGTVAGNLLLSMALPAALAQMVPDPRGAM